ncbi:MULTISPECIES: TetR/AcrR family transcriptional regulator [unclassified Peribacillus]|uniref:TetR/AcrR family transcriptional regulator n=1 Tax=unclassified Peribacillus TaxID=2675266 RepID=UPI00191495A7|nr:MULTISPECIES: TetR/AcrR family transcriptional regulator [unclassified Peribacillus]MBK5444098.1 TetR/AcrR family transcriptional regulator [Peribacillus sp. TH24]MBK5461182.1 TetR/AcrR family transcriptional regulator [Peribacillus sp. TH27]MBK5485497.1 TetR/AcrR family transcriptional regulator [Peribacillus sp. TH16]MBK5499324.1 TetR/AcrR family transcriptional regulator [Peribacillus sp. TH14]WMX55579.1 TetR/AcrR family transcriptional regulator [Peribacillus sp. R9-11]
MEKREVHASVKDERLVEKRRTQMIKGAVTLFKEKGFHRTTTREIAKAAGFSIGTLYEYIRTKEDVLYLVCDFIYDEVQEKLQKEIEQSDGTLESLKLTIAYFYQVMDEMQDEVLVMYQEVKALTKDALPYVLNKEIQMVGMFEKVITKCVENGELLLTENQISLVSHNIFVQGQMWSFRRWALHKKYTLQEYVELQTQLLIQNVSIQKSTLI